MGSVILTAHVWLVLVSQIGDEVFETKTARTSIGQCEEQVEAIKANKLIFPYPVIDVYCRSNL